VESPRAAEKNTPGEKGNSAGIALFMVLAAVAILSVLITEFTYIASINQKMAYDSLDLVKAHYVAKSALKLSLLRLKAYQHIKAFINGAAGGAAGAGAAGGAAGLVPKGAVEKIWSFPFFYPLPTNIPGMGAADRDAIEKFQKESNLEGRFTAAITSESARYNLNQNLQTFSASAQPSPGPSGQPRPGASPNPPPSPTPGSSPNPQASFSPDEARKSMTEYFTQILTTKFEDDPDFAQEHRDLRIEDVMDQVFGWNDRTYERKNPSDRDPMKFRRSPYNTVTELHMLPIITDELYDLFAPTLTVSSTPGININTMEEQTLKILVPGITKEEVADFFKFRDSEEEDNLFKTEEDFFKYLQNNVAIFRRSASDVDRFKQELAKRTRLVVDETQFKITVTAQVNQSSELIEAWVTTSQSQTTSQPTTPGTPKTGPSPQPQPQPGAEGAPQTRPDTGLKITFMRIL
jgi:type II secretory pathway component PulK